jgi:hypothetical protein
LLPRLELDPAPRLVVDADGGHSHAGALRRGRIFDLYLTSLLFEAGAVAILLALLLIFQDDLRRAAEQFAVRGFFTDEPPRPSSSTIDLIADTARELAEGRVGALLVFPGREPLDRFLRGGERLNGVVSRSLLVSIFHPGSPGHDGAALIDGDVVTRFAVHLPSHGSPKRSAAKGPAIPPRWDWPNGATPWWWLFPKSVGRSALRITEHWTLSKRPP